MTTALTVEQVRADTMAGLSMDEIMAKHGVSWQTVKNRRREGGITDRAPSKHHGRTEQTRFNHRPLGNLADQIRLASDHPAIIESRTLFPRSVSSNHPRILISGHNQPKIGRVVTKGPWRDFPIYTLTLEERTTCPSSCGHWNDCYGNRMHWSRRHVHGHEFEDRLVAEIDTLAFKHRRGFAVRLHILGDFYSRDYVALWEGLIVAYSALRVFGFTARWSDEIGCDLRGVAERWPKRFAIRFSDAPTDEMSTVSIARGEDAPSPAIQCPQQTGRTLACATCGLCWHSRRPVAFMGH